MIDKENIKDIKSSRLVDELEHFDEKSIAEIEKMLQDNELANDARLVMGIRHTRMRQHAAAPDVEREWKLFSQRHIEVEKRKARTISLRNVFYLVASVAAIILVIFVITHFGQQPDNSMLAFESNNAPKSIMIGDEDSDMAPIGKEDEEEGVILTNGKADFSKVKAENMKETIKTITTPRGRDYEVVLSDGTMVLLNADSKLVFPVHFSGKNRVVKLVGEAYFKVSKNKHLPFIVQTEKLTTRVLGTEFNLKAYPHSPANVTLINGSVAVNSAGKEVMLKPGQNVQVDSNHDFDVSTVDTECYTQWKDGYFYFDNVPLIDVVRELGRWYNVNIEIRDNSLMSYRLHFIASRKSSIKEFVDNLNEFNYLSVVQKGNKLIIDKKEK